MIIWLNGPFAVGKTTLAERLHRQWPEATILDPESLGFLLREWQPSDVEVADFQDLSVWRSLTRVAIAGLVEEFRRPLIVPMTLLRPAYFDEVVGGLRSVGMDVRHYCLVASREEVLRRAEGRVDRDTWAAPKYDEHVNALDDDRFATFLDAERSSPEDLAGLIIEDIGGDLPTVA